MKTTVDGDVVGDPRRFTVWVDDTPARPEVPLTAGQAARDFRQYLAEDPDAKVEIQAYEDFE